ncbi:MAG: hypothetical protein C0505_08625 [Leptothrix sp. (in: Bacteria)]|nr:hypothetical protein [Leptothrix sp. (in: b-proteobacteria)]
MAEFSRSRLLEHGTPAAEPLPLVSRKVENTRPSASRPMKLPPKLLLSSVNALLPVQPPLRQLALQFISAPNSPGRHRWGR